MFVLKSAFQVLLNDCFKMETVVITTYETLRSV